MVRSTLMTLIICQHHVIMSTSPDLAEMTHAHIELVIFALGALRISTATISAYATTTNCVTVH